MENSLGINWPSFDFPSTPGGGGTVTDVALAAPAEFTVAGSPVTTSGTLTLAWAVRSPNTVLAGPTTGPSAAPTFRCLVPADLGTGTANSSTFLRGDGTWQTPPSGFADPMTSIGDMIIRNGSNVTTRLGIGTSGQVLTVVGGVPAWATGFSDPMTTDGDIIIRSGGFASRLGIGSSNQVLTVSGGLPTWVTPGWPMTTNGDIIIRSGGVATRLGIGTTGQLLQVVGGLPAWTTVGATTQIFYNNGGLPSAESSFTWSTANKTLSISASNTSFTGLTVSGATRSLTALGLFNVTSGAAQGQAWLGYAGSQGNSSVLAIATSSSMAAIRAMLSTGVVSSVEDPIVIQSGTSGFSPSAGFGAAVMTRLVAGSSGTYYDAGRHAVVWSDATVATRSAYHAWSTTHLGSVLTERMRLTSDGVLRVGSSTIYFGLRPGGSGTPVWTMPVADGTSGQVLSTDGAGVLSWITAGGFTDPMTTNGDIIIRSGGVATRLGIGTAGQVLTVVSGLPSWQNASSGFADPMTTAGDIIIRNGSNVTARLGIGTSGQVLTVAGGVPAWATPFTDPMTTNGDIIIRSGGVATRLGIGTAGQVLTVVSGLPAWQNASSGFADPMTTAGDIIIRNGSNVTARLGVGTNGQVLTVTTGVPAWQDTFTDPMTTNGDIIIRAGGFASRLGVGSSGQVLTVSGGLPAWATPFTDPMTTNGDIIIRSGGVATRLPIGTAGQFLRVSSGLPAWETVSVMTDPMTTAGDIVIRNGSNVTARLGIGTSGQVLTVAGGVPAWATPFSDPMTTNGDIIIRSGGVATRLPIGTSDQVLTVSGGLPTWVTPGWPMTTSGDMIYRSGSTTTRLPIGTSGHVLTAVSGTPTWQAVELTVGTTNIISGTGGRMFYQTGSNTLGQTSQMHWDATNSRLGLGTTTPSVLFHVLSSTSATMVQMSGVNTTTGSPVIVMENTSTSADSGVTLRVSSLQTGANAVTLQVQAAQGQALRVDTTDTGTWTPTNAISTFRSLGALSVPILSLERGVTPRNQAQYTAMLALVQRTGNGSTPTPSASLGTGVDVSLLASDLAPYLASSLRTVWSTATAASRTSYLSLQLVSSATTAETARWLAGGIMDLTNAAGELRVNGTKVVGARITGWQMPTGTQARTTFDTSAVTTEQLAQRVYALINDLFGHGLIGT